jgi:hypothetical protein
MTVTINAQKYQTQRAILRVVSKVWDVGRSLPMSQSYFAPDAYGNRYLYPGLIVGYNDDKTEYVPVDSAGSYGVYATYTYAAGIIADFFDFTYQDQIVAPATRAAFVEQYVYLYGEDLGTVPDEVKAALHLSQWD